MWTKSLVGIVLSLLLSVSLIFNIHSLTPISLEGFLELGFIFVFVLWASIMSIYYCADTMKKPLLYSLPVLLLSAAVNAAALTGLI